MNRRPRNPARPSFDRLITARFHFTSFPQRWCRRQSFLNESHPSLPTGLRYSSAEELAAARRCSPNRLNRILRGDLDAIILTAMRKEPERRYASAAHFALDLTCYLKRLPVSAERNSVTYRTLKFMRRNVAAVVVSALLGGVLVAGIVGITMGLIMARRERDRAQRSFQQALKTVNQFFTQVDEERLLIQPGLDPLRKALFEDTRRSYEDLLAGRGGDRSLQPELAASANQSGPDFQCDRINDDGRQRLRAGCCALGSAYRRRAGEFRISRSARTHAYQAGQHDDASSGPAR